MGSMVLLDLLGGVALLLWGLHMVHSGILRAFGPDLRLVLSKALRNRFSAFAAGVGLTALLQSSTATGLIASSFATDGVVGLVPALAIMLGVRSATCSTGLSASCWSRHSCVRSLSICRPGSPTMPSSRPSFISPSILPPPCSSSACSMAWRGTPVPRRIPCSTPPASWRPCAARTATSQTSLPRSPRGRSRIRFCRRQADRSHRYPPTDHRSSVCDPLALVFQISMMFLT
jgi:Na+/Pi-cotransporter